MDQARRPAIAVRIAQQLLSSINRRTNRHQNCQGGHCEAHAAAHRQPGFAGSTPVPDDVLGGLGRALVAPGRGRNVVEQAPREGMTDLVPGARGKRRWRARRFRSPAGSTLRRRRRRNRRAGGSARREPSELRPELSLPARTDSSMATLAASNSPSSASVFAQVRQDPEPPFVVGRKETGGASQQVGGRMHVATGEGAAPRRSISGEPRRRRWPARGRPAGPGRPDRGRPVRDGSRGSPQIRGPWSGARLMRSAHPTNRSWSEARVRFSRRWYARP